jgi:uncharacterized protein (DUF58 family)
MLFPDFRELVKAAHKASRLKLVSGRQSTAVTSGDYASPFRRQGLEFHEVREYRVGDDIRNIDWRVTARTDKPHVKVFIEARERTVILCVDANAAMRFGTRGTFKSVQAARAAALLGWQATGSGDRVGCLLYGDVPDGMQFFMSKRSRRALWQSLRLLSETRQGVHKTPVALETALKYLEQEAPTGALVFVIADFHQVTPALEKRLGHLRLSCDIVLVSVNDPADGEIPAMKTVVFADESGRKLAVDTDNLAAREAYARRWRENRDRLEDIVARRGLGLVDLHTDRDVYADLLPGLRRLKLRKAR